MPSSIYNGFWFAPEREMLQAAIDKSQEFVTGRVRLKLYKGSVVVIGRESPYSLYDQDLVTFEEGAVAYDQRDAAGFIKLNALRLRTLGAAQAQAQAALNEARRWLGARPFFVFWCCWRLWRRRARTTRKLPALRTRCSRPPTTSETSSPR